MTEHDLVKGIDSGPIVEVMAGNIARMLLIGALALGVMGFCIIGIAKVLP